ncbi:hypothetical protein BAY59_38495 (plasmid) [Prauserella coralliicola]|nr:hypothetical protein BAY59_38495 [Prauserella coralliicola]
MPTITEQLVAALTAAWRAIRAQHPEVPDIVLTLGSGTLGKRGKGEVTLGHFARGRWQLTEQPEGTEPGEGLHELFVSGEGLRRSPDKVLATLLHEAAHALAAVREINDTSRQGRYHNRKFKALGEELGLEITEDGPLGWSGTALAEGTAQRYRAELDQLREALRWYRLAEQPGMAGKSKSKNLLVAECACPRKIRVARTTLDEAPITCGACGSEFAAEDDDGADEV